MVSTLVTMNIKQFPKFSPNELSTFLMKEFCITGWQDLNSPQYLFISPFNKEQALGIELSGGKSLNSALFSMCLHFSVVLNLARHIVFLFMVNLSKKKKKVNWKKILSKEVAKWSINMEETMGVVGMSDICETMKKHETTLHFLTLNLTFGVYGYQTDTITTCLSELNLFFTH